MLFRSVSQSRYPGRKYDFFDEHGNQFHRGEGGDLIIFPAGGGGDSITVKRFFTGAEDGFENKFGVTVSEAKTPEATEPAPGDAQFEVGSGLLGKKYYYDGISKEYIAHDHYLSHDYDHRKDSAGEMDDLGNSLDQSFINNLSIRFVFGEFEGWSLYGSIRSFEGGDRDDVLIGGSNLWGMKGDDYIEGAGSNGLLVGGAGSDSILGGAGADDIYLDDKYDNDAIGSGDDYANGGEGNDRISGSGGSDFIIDKSGNNFLGGGSGRDTLLAGDGDDIVAGDGYVGFADGLIYGLLQSNSTLASDFYSDFIDAGNGNNKIFGGAGNDTVLSGIGNDIIHGDMSTRANYPYFPFSSYVELPVSKHGDDRIYANAGNDTVLGGGGNDFISGGDGADYLWGDDSDTAYSGLAGNDML